MADKDKKKDEKKSLTAEEYQEKRAKEREADANS